MEVVVAGRAVAGNRWHALSGQTEASSLRGTVSEGLGELNRARAGPARREGCSPGEGREQFLGSGERCVERVVCVSSLGVCGQTSDLPRSALVPPTSFLSDCVIPHQCVSSAGPNGSPGAEGGAGRGDPGTDGGCPAPRALPLRP